MCCHMNRIISPNIFYNCLLQVYWETIDFYIDLVTTRITINSMRVYCVSILITALPSPWPKYKNIWATFLWFFQLMTYPLVSLCYHLSNNNHCFLLGWPKSSFGFLVGRNETRTNYLASPNNVKNLGFLFRAFVQWLELPEQCWITVARAGIPRGFPPVGQSGVLPGGRGTRTQ